MKRDIRRCEKCEHYKAYKTKSGVWAKACESWECEFEPKTTFCVAPECDQCVLSDTEKCPDRLKAESEDKE